MLVYLLVFGWSLIDSNVYVELFFYIIDGVVIVCFYSVGYGNFVIVLFEILQLYVDVYNMGFLVNLNVVMCIVKRVLVGVEEFGFGFRVCGDEWGGDCYWVMDQDFFVLGCVGEVIYMFVRISNFGNLFNVYFEVIYQFVIMIGIISKFLYIVFV